MPDLTFINHANKIVPLQEAAVPVLSPGSLFADPMYESISVSHHNPFYLCHPLQCLEQKIPPFE